MALASGMDAQLGYAAEGTYGTYQTPTRFTEFTKETLRLEVERIESKGIRTGRRVLHRWHSGVQRVIGDIEMEVAPQGAALMWKHLIGGADTIAGADPYTHTLSPGDLAALSMTIQVNRTDITGTDRVFSYLGCVFTDWELACKVNELANLKVGVYGAHEDRAQSLAAVSYPTNFSPFVFTHGSLSVAGSGYDVHEISVKSDNMLKKDRHFIRATTPARPKIALEAGLRAITGTFKSDFESLTAYERFVNGTEAALVLTFDAGASAKMVITMNVRYDGQTPYVEGHDLLTQELPFKAVHSTADASAFTVVITNADSAS